MYGYLKALNEEDKQTHSLYWWSHH